MEAEPSQVELYCPGCGYDLRAIESVRCPECGLEIDRRLIAESLIPWFHRHKLGEIRAFVRTVLMAFRRPSKLASSSAVSVSFEEAQKFRWYVVLLTWVPMCGWALLARHLLNGWADKLPMPSPSPGWVPPALPMWTDPAICWWVGVMSWPVPSAALLLMLAGLSGVASYWFHPSSLPLVRQNRAVAVSYYACGPLALLAVLLLLLGLPVSLIALNAEYESTMYRYFFALGLMIVFCAVVIFIAWFHATIRTLKTSTHCSIGRMVAAMICIPLLWLAMIVLTLGVFPAVCGYVKLMIQAH